MGKEYTDTMSLTVMAPDAGDEHNGPWSFTILCTVRMMQESKCQYVH